MRSNKHIKRNRQGENNDYVYIEFDHFMSQNNCLE